MSKILKRPMFRKGGKVEEGVMSLAAPRNNYETGGAVDFEKLLEDDPYLQETYELAKAGYGRDVARERKDVLANLLIRGGLGLVSGEGAGKGTLGSIATAFKKPTEQALTEMKGLRQDPAKMLTAKTAIAQKGAERLQMLKNKEDLAKAVEEAKVILGPDASQEQINKLAGDIQKEKSFGVGQRFEKAQEMDRIEVIQKQEDLSFPEAAAVYEFQQNSKKVKEATGLDIGARGGVIIGFIKNGKLDYGAAAKSLPDGIYLDPTNKTYVKIQSGRPSIIPDPFTSTTIEDTSIKVEPGEEIIEEKRLTQNARGMGNRASSFEEETQIIAQRPESQRFR